LEDKVHVVLIKDYVHQPKQLHFFVCIHQLAVMLINVPLELRVEVRLYYRLVVYLQSGC
jgi:hypothetical protein